MGQTKDGKLLIGKGGAGSGAFATAARGEKADEGTEQAKESPAASVFFGGGPAGAAKATGGGVLPRMAGGVFGLGNAFKGLFGRGGGASASYLDQSRGK